MNDLVPVALDLLMLQPLMAADPELVARDSAVGMPILDLSMSRGCP